MCVCACVCMCGKRMEGVGVQVIVICGGDKGGGEVLVPSEHHVLVSKTSWYG